MSRSRVGAVVVAAVLVVVAGLASPAATASGGASERAGAVADRQPRALASFHAEQDAWLWRDAPDQRSLAWLPGASEVTATRGDDGAISLLVRSEQETVRLRLAAPRGAELARGTYPYALSSDRDAGVATPARLDVTVRGATCSSVGAFRVLELDQAMEDVWITWEARCDHRSGRVFGEVRLGGGEQQGPSTSVDRVDWPAQHVGPSGLVVPVRVLDGVGPVFVDLEGDDDFRVVSGTCAGTAPGPCRVLVGFDPDRPGAARATLVLSDDSGTREVLLTGSGRPGTSNVQVDSGDGVLRIEPADRLPTVVVVGDASRIEFQARYPRPGSRGWTDQVTGHVAVPGGGLRAGATFRGVSSFSSREPSLQVSREGGGPVSRGRAEFTVHRADYDADGGLRELALTYRIGGQPQEVTGAVNWQADDPSGPPTPAAPVRQGPPRSVVVEPQVGAAEISWNPASPRAIVTVRTVSTGARERTVYRGRGPRIQVRDLDTTRDHVLSVRFGESGSRASLRVGGARLTLAPGRVTGGVRPVRGRLVDAAGRGRAGLQVRVHLRAPGAVRTTRRVETGRDGLFVLRSVRSGTRVEAAYAGTDGFRTPGIFGAATVLRVPRG